MTRPSAVRKGPEAEPAPPARAEAKILIVDDDERNLLALTEVLDPLAEIVTVSSGRDALRALLKDDFAVILLDVYMPEMDGYETAGFIRQREQTARIPIIFLSAVNKETEHLMRGYAMGAVDYVFKPVDPLVLRSKAAVFVDLYVLRRQIEQQARAEQDLREATMRAEAQRLEAERELQQTRLRQAAILNSLPLVLFEASYSKDVGIKRRVVGGDRRALAEDAASWFQHDGAQWEDQILPEDREVIRREYERAARPGERTTVRYRWAVGEGSPLHLLEQAVRVDEDAWIGSITDITAQRQLEDQLLQTQKLDALGQLTGGVAHDFNNLLAAMLGGIELLQRRVELAEPERQILDQMRHAADQGVALVRSLLAFARKQPLRPSIVDPDDRFRSVAGLVEHTMGRAIRVEWRVAANGRKLYADSAQLTLALVNLLINARDAMPDGGAIEVSIDECDIAADGREMLCIAVRDQGSGIPAEIIAKVTEPFFTTKPAGKGTGLGLSMVAGFAEQSGGSLNIASPPEGGTCVEIRLPAVAPAPETAPKPLRPKQPVVAANSGCVLLVDDDESVRTILAEIIQDLGLKVTTAGDGAVALNELRKKSNRFDFVLTDVTMPKMNGVELINAMKKENIQVPVAMMTGNPRDGLLEQFGDELEILCKPLDSAKLAKLFAGL
jgi:signal transduction histidine kinase